MILLPRFVFCSHQFTLVQTVFRCALWSETLKRIKLMNKSKDNFIIYLYSFDFVFMQVVLFKECIKILFHPNNEFKLGFLQFSFQLYLFLFMAFLEIRSLLFSSLELQFFNSLLFLRFEVLQFLPKVKRFLNPLI